MKRDAKSLANTWHKSATTGVRNTFLNTAKNAAVQKINDGAADGISKKIASGLNKTPIMWNKGLVAESVTGCDRLFTASPDAVTKLIRQGVSKGTPIIGSVLDYSLSRASGETKTDSAIKAVAHTGISIATGEAGMAFGAKLGTIVSPGVGTAIGAVVGFVAGAVGTVIFDEIYDKSR